MRLPALVLLVPLMALIAGCEHGPGYPPRAMERPEEVTDFAALYRQNCAACHGANGESGPAMDLANPEYQALVDDATLRKWISGGMPGTEMPAFAQSAGGMLTDEQVNAVITGMREHWLRTGVFAGTTPPAYAQTQPGNTQAGEQAYQSRCSSCHTRSRQQIASPDYLALVGDQALRSIIIAGRPDIGQPDWSHLGPGGKTATPLSGQDIDDIVAYLASLRNSAQAASTPAKQPAAGVQTER